MTFRAKNSFWVSIFILIIFGGCELQDVPSLDKLPKDQRIALLAEQEYKMTANPSTGEVPREQLYQVRAAMSKEIQTRSNNQNASWIARGPDNVGGRTRAICVDRRDSTGGTLLVGSVSGGLWRCNDALNDPQWTRVDSYAGSPSISSIVQDPSDNRTWYVATGEGWFNADAYRGDGIYKSTDDGFTWARLESTDNFRFRYTQKLLHNAAGDLMACTQGRGVMRSSDGGETWDEVLRTTNGSATNRAADIEMATNGDLYAGMGIFTQDGVYKSVDNGDTWVELLLPTTLEYERVEIALSPVDSNRVLVLLQGEESRGCEYILESTDGGDTWRELSVPDAIGMSNFARNQAWYDLIAAYHPVDTSIIYIGGVDLHRTTDAGATWQQLSNWREGQQPIYVHADQHAMTYIPGRDDAMYFGNDGGLWLTEDLRSPEPFFRDLSQDYISTQFYACSVHPDPEVIYYLAGAQDNGTQALTTEGVGPSFERLGGDGAYNHIDQETGDIQIAAFQRGRYVYTTDAWNTLDFFYPDRTSLFINPTTYHTPSKTFYASYAEGGYLYLEPETGAIDSFFVAGLGDQNVSAITADPYDGEQLYLGSEDGIILRITDAKSADFQVEVLRLGSAYVRSIDIDRGNPDRLLIAHSNYGIQNIFISENSGSDWIPMDLNLPDVPVRWAIFSPSDSNLLLAATEVGIWELDLDTDDPQWVFVSEEIGAIRVDMLVPRETDGHIAAATYGRGLYTSDTYTSASLAFATSQVSLVEPAVQDGEPDCRSISELLVDVRVNQVIDSAVAFTVTLSGDAVRGLDYDIDRLSDTIPAGASSVSLAVTLYGDRVARGDREIILDLSSPNFPIRIGRQVITITEDDDSFASGGGLQAYAYGDRSSGLSAIFSGFWEDGKSHILYTEDILSEAGIIGVVDISQMSLFIESKSSTIPYANLSLKLANYDDEELSTAEFLDEGLLEVFTGDYETREGVNDFVFTQPFTYDGSGGLLVEICYDNTDYTGDDVLVTTSVGTKILTTSHEEDRVVGCAMTTPFEIYQEVPDVVFLTQAAEVLSIREDFPLASIIPPGSEAYYSQGDSIVAKVASDDTSIEDCISVTLTDGSPEINYCSSGAADCYNHTNRTYSINSEVDQPLTVTLYFDTSDESFFADTSSISIYAIETETYLETSFVAEEGYIAATFTYDEAGMYRLQSERSVSTVDLAAPPVEYDQVLCYDIMGRVLPVDDDGNLVRDYRGVIIRAFIIDDRIVYTDRIAVIR